MRRIAKLLVGRVSSPVPWFDTALALAGLIAFGAILAAQGPLPAVAFDADGDRRADPAVYRSSRFYALGSTSGYQEWSLGGLDQDIPIVADYDGDRRDDVIVYRGGWWYIRASTAGYLERNFGGAVNDVPVVADYDGDNRADLAVYRGGWWYIQASTTGYRERNFGGAANEIPVVADYDGDNRADLAVYRGGWWYIQASTAGYRERSFGGASNDVPVVADYDGDNRADIAVYRAGWWYIQASTAGYSERSYGGATNDVPVVADYDGDNRADLAVYRGGTWLWLSTRTGGEEYRLLGGLPGDVPLLQPAATRLPQRCTYTVTLSKTVAGSQGEALTANVSTHGSCQWTASTSNGWITLSSASGSGTSSVTVSVAANSGGARSSDVVIAGQTVTVSQLGTSSGNPPGSDPPPATTVDYCGAEDVTSSVQVIQTPFTSSSFNFVERTLTIRNTGNQSIQGPISLVFEGLPRYGTGDCQYGCGLQSASITNCKSDEDTAMLTFDGPLDAGEELNTTQLFVPATGAWNRNFDYVLRVLNGRPSR